MNNSHIETIKIRSKNGQYDIDVGRNILEDSFGEILETYKDHKIAIIMDSNVQKIYGNQLEKKLDGKDQVYFLSFKAGEESKNRQVKDQLEDKLFELGCSRDTVIVAFGGGVTGDISGFVAATYMRGVPFIQVPTTLLSQVDSSIGGKVGIDHPSGKNLIGAFYPPDKVYIDIELLKSLPKEEIINGISEIIKASIIKDSTLFDYLEDNIECVINLEDKYIENAIISSLKVKANVVELDEKEGGLRKILNFGHTIGHSIEVLSDYKLSHGRAVGIGMAVESLISEKIGILNHSEKERIFRLLDRSKLLEINLNFSSEEIIKKTLLDKKTRKGIVEYALVKGIGKAVYGLKVENDVVKEALLEIGFS